jgi:hypothetical protein
MRFLRLLPVTILIVLIALKVARADGPVFDFLAPGQCITDPYSKTYVDASANPIKYSCLYKCSDNDGKFTTIKAAHEFFKTGDFYSEMVGLVCKGAEVAQKSNGVRTSWDMVAVHSFWARATELSEIRSWAISNDVKISSEAFQEMKLELRKQFLQVGFVYFRADTENFPEFREAALVLVEIGSGTEKGEALLLEYVRRIQAGEFPKSKADELIYLNINQLGRFLF